MSSPVDAHDEQPPRLAHLDDYERYGRQMIIDPFGLQGQLKVQNASVLVVGAGGLGCPALQYLVAAGVGKFTIVDHDNVDLSNLQRQILHTESRIGMNKAESAAIALRQLNSRVAVTPYPHALTPDNATELVAAHDLALDCSDNAPTRYLLSDTAARLRRPLISGAAQQLAGHICTLTYDETAPCYRCLFPRAPAPEHQGSCAEVGILGAVTGVIGALQAAEAIKVLAGMRDGPPSMLLYDMRAAPPFRNVKLRARRKDCAACGDASGPPLSSDDYVRFCGGPRPDWVGLGVEEGVKGERISAGDMKVVVDEGEGVCVLDVRPWTEFGICRLPGSKHVPLPELVADPSKHVPPGSKDVFVVCRLGNDSQVAAAAIRVSEVGRDVRVRDLIGGLRAWSKEVDAQFPIY